MLVTRASGGVGSYAVQLTRTLGAQVAGVCSTAKLEPGQLTPSLYRTYPL